jgi:hypothetical protein
VFFLDLAKRKSQTRIYLTGISSQIHRGTNPDSLSKSRGRKHPRHVGSMEMSCGLLRPEPQKKTIGSVKKKLGSRIPNLGIIDDLSTLVIVAWILIITTSKNNCERGREWKMALCKNSNFFTREMGGGNHVRITKRPRSVYESRCRLANEFRCPAGDWKIRKHRYFELMTANPADQPRRFPRISPAPFLLLRSSN